MLIGLLLLDMYKQYSPPIFLQKKKTLRFCSLPSISLSSTVNTFLFVFFYTLVQLLLIPSRFPALTFCRITLYDRSTSYNSAYRVAASPRRQKFTSPTIPYLLSIHVYIALAIHLALFLFLLPSSLILLRCLSGTCHHHSLETAIYLKKKKKKCPHCSLFTVHLSLTSFLVKSQFVVFFFISKACPVNYRK